MEIQLKGSKKEVERYEKELNKQMEALKALDIQLSELKKAKSSSELTSPAKKQGEISRNVYETTGSPNLNKKGTISSEENKKVQQGSDKKGHPVCKTNTLSNLEQDSSKKTQAEPKNADKTNSGDSNSQQHVLAASEEKIRLLNKKIVELEKFINAGIDEGFTQSQYNKLQSGLELLGFTPFKKQFKAPKPETSDKRVDPPSKIKKSAESSSGKYTFEPGNDGLVTDKSMSFSTNLSFSKDPGQNPGFDKNLNSGAHEISKTPSETTKKIASPLEKAPTIQIMVTNPTGKISERPLIYEDRSQSLRESQISNNSQEQSPSKLQTLPGVVAQSQGMEVIISVETKKEEKTPEIKIPPPPPTTNSEANSPSNSPMNVPPLPPPIMGGKPGLPPGLNLLNLLNKKPGGPVKDKLKPNVPMKSILWTLVNPLNIKGTIWETIDERTATYEIPNLEAEFTSVRPDKPVAKSTIPAKVILLAPNRSQNLNIVLSKLKMSPSSIVEAILTVNEEVLTLNIVNCLLDAIPTQDEISLVSNYNGDMDMLENPEKFILEIKDVKNLKVRLQAMQFFFTHKELFDDLQLKISKLIELFENISKEKRIIMLMKYTLAIGNYMNGESARGGAFGFKLDVFDKMGDIKNVSGKKTLLAFVIDIIEKNMGMVFIDMNEEFPLYEFGRKQSISQLFADLDFIKKGIEQVKNAKQAKNTAVVDNIEIFMGKFEVEVSDKFQEVEFELNTLDQKYKRVCEFFCEDPKQISSDSFVDNFYKIWTSCKKAKGLLIKENKEALKESLKEKAKEKSEKPGKN